MAFDQRTSWLIARHETGFSAKIKEPGAESPTDPQAPTESEFGDFVSGGPETDDPEPRQPGQGVERPWINTLSFPTPEPEGLRSAIAEAEAAGIRDDPKLSREPEEARRMALLRDQIEWL